MLWPLSLLSSRVMGLRSSGSLATEAKSNEDRKLAEDMFRLCVARGDSCGLGDATRGSGLVSSANGGPSWVESALAVAIFFFTFAVCRRRLRHAKLGTSLRLVFLGAKQWGAKLLICLPSHLEHRLFFEFNCACNNRRGWKLCSSADPCGESNRPLFPGACWPLVGQTPNRPAF